MQVPPCYKRHLGGGQAALSRRPYRGTSNYPLCSFRPDNSSCSLPHNPRRFFTFGRPRSVEPIISQAQRKVDGVLASVASTQASAESFVEGVKGGVEGLSSFAQRAAAVATGKEKQARGQQEEERESTRKTGYGRHQFSFCFRARCARVLVGVGLFRSCGWVNPPPPPLLLSESSLSPRTKAYVFRPQPITRMQEPRPPPPPLLCVCPSPLEARAPLRTPARRTYLPPFDTVW